MAHAGAAAASRREYSPAEVEAVAVICRACDVKDWPAVHAAVAAATAARLDINFRHLGFNGHTPLTRALVFDAPLDVVDALLVAGVSASTFVSVYSPLRLAVERKASPAYVVALIRRLLDAGADARVHLSRPLLSTLNCVEVVDDLVAAGAPLEAVEVNLVNPYTPLFRNLLGWDYKMAVALLDAGADVLAPLPRGQTPVDLIRRRVAKFPEMVKGAPLVEMVEAAVAEGAAGLARRKAGFVARWAWKRRRLAVAAWQWAVELAAAEYEEAVAGGSRSSMWV